MVRTLALVIALSVPAGLAVADEVAPPTAGRRAPAQSQPPAGGGAPMPRSEQMIAPSRPMPPRKPPVVVTPAREIAALGKQLAGTWICKGNSMRGDGSSTPLVATVTNKLELDNAWIVTTLVEKSGPLKWTEFRSYDPVAKQWTRIQFANTAGHVISTSLGEQGGKWTWVGTASSPNGSFQLRDFEQRDGKAMKVWGEAMLGGTWTKLFETTCRR